MNGEYRGLVMCTDVYLFSQPAAKSNGSNRASDKP